MVKFEPNSTGIQQLLKSPEMMEICKGYANNAAARLGSGYAVSTFTGKTRVNASVTAETAQARRENSDNNSILKAVFSQ